MATTVNPKTFPGVYTSITDNSFVQPAASRFRPGLIGVATKGSFHTATAVRSLKEFQRFFGAPLATSYLADGDPSGSGYFLADAVAMLSDLTDGITVVRVGSQYTELDIQDISGVSGSWEFGTSQAPFLVPTNDAPVFVRIQQAGKPTTINASVIAAGNDSLGNGTVKLDVTGTALEANYQSATLAFSHVSGAANSAESVLYAYTYGVTSSGSIDAQVTSVGSITGSKNDFTFTVQSNPANINVGDVYKITEAGKFDTHEVRVKNVQGNTVFLETSDLTRVGYQALPLQDSYDSGLLFRATGEIAFLYLQASSEGEWANGADSKTGLFVKILPGSKGGTKKMEIYQDAALVETFDNLSAIPSSVDWYVTRINNISQYITISNVNQVGGGQIYHAANTAAPWDTAYLPQNLVAVPKSMPVGEVNAGGTSGGNFANGANGASATDSDFIGTINPNDDTPTGIKCFEDTDTVSVNVIAAPMDNISVGIMQELNRVAKEINAIALADVPAGLNARLAVDWHNGQGQFKSSQGGRIDSPNLAVYWNWFNVTDPFSGNVKLVPPTLGALRCMAFTFDREKPWYAAAGETKGWIPEALSLEFEKVGNDAKQAMYGNGNSVNPILRIRGKRIVLFGERTMQVAESKLSAVHSVVLVNYIVTGLALIARRYVFDPNDAQLLVLIRLAFSEFLDKIKNERGMEDYSLVIDDRNNNADTRNQRQVIADLSVIPTDVAERIFINLTAKESGAVLNSLNA